MPTGPGSAGRAVRVTAFRLLAAIGGAPGDGRDAPSREPYRRLAPRSSPVAARTNGRPGRHRQRVVLVFEAGALSGGLGQALRDHGLGYFGRDDVDGVRHGRAQLRATAPGASVHRLGAATCLIRDVAGVVWTQPFEGASRVPRRLEPHAPARHGRARPPAAQAGVQLTREVSPAGVDRVAASGSGRV